MPIWDWKVPSKVNPNFLSDFGSMYPFARLLMILGVILFLIGGLIYLIARLGIPLGRLPGDIRIQGDNFTCFFPIATTILLSIILTMIINIIARYLNR